VINPNQIDTRLAALQCQTGSLWCSPVSPLCWNALCWFLPRRGFSRPLKSLLRIAAENCCQGDWLGSLTEAFSRIIRVGGGVTSLPILDLVGEPARCELFGRKLENCSRTSHFNTNSAHFWQHTYLLNEATIKDLRYIELKLCYHQNAIQNHSKTFNAIYRISLYKSLPNPIG